MWQESIQNLVDEIDRCIHNGWDAELTLKAMAEFDYDASGYVLDTKEERVFYFYHDCQRFFKYVRPVKKA